MSDPYAAHQAFIRPAYATPERWRIVVMLIAFETIFMLSPSIFASFLPNDEAVHAYYEGVTTFGTLAQFATFGISAVGLVVLLRLVHGRGFWSVVGPKTALRRDLVVVSSAVAVWLLVVNVMPPWINRGDLAEVRNIGVWMALIPITLVVLLIQVGTEEMFFRGYLQQQLACLSDSRLIWMVLPSAMFGTLHFWNGNGVADGTIWAVWAMALGLACADLTARTGNLGAAIGLHLANNAFALLIVSVQGWPSSGVALFLYPYEDPALHSYPFETVFTWWGICQLLSMLLSVAIMWLAGRIALRR